MFSLTSMDFGSLTVKIKDLFEECSSKLSLAKQLNLWSHKMNFILALNFFPFQKGEEIWNNRIEFENSYLIKLAYLQLLRVGVILLEWLFRILKFDIIWNSGKLIGSQRFTALSKQGGSQGFTLCCTVICIYYRNQIIIS